MRTVLTSLVMTSGKATAFRPDKPKKPEKPERDLGVNRQASHEYFFLERFEAGLVLTGTEVKAARSGRVGPSVMWFCAIFSTIVWPMLTFGVAG